MHWAQNGPSGLGKRVAGGPVRYKQDVAKGNQTSLSCNQIRAGQNRRQKEPCNSHMASGTQWPQRGKPWADYGEPDDGKSGKCPGLQDGLEVSIGVRAESQALQSMA